MCSLQDSETSSCSQRVAGGWPWCRCLHQFCTVHKKACVKRTQLLHPRGPSMHMCAAKWPVAAGCISSVLYIRKQV
jgi:hypothetical protein